MHSEDQTREALLLVLDQRFCEFVEVHAGRERSKRFFPKNETSYLVAARILGNMMGERLFLAVHQGRMDRSTLLEILHKDIDDRDFAQFYGNLVKRLESSVSPQIEELNL
jgi:hypothetical protein